MTAKFFSALICTTIGIGAATADVTRGCSAQWEVRNPSTGDVRGFGRFESRGRCRSSVYANDCRRAARQYAQDCFNSAFEERWNTDINSGRLKPPNCVGRGDIGVRSYGVVNLKSEIERHACSFQSTTPFPVDVIGRTFGGTRCSGALTISSYEIKDEMCGKR